MDWTVGLQAGIRDAIGRNGKVRIAVHTEDQAALGKMVAWRLNPDRADNLSFEVIPPNEQDLYPIGIVLV